MKRFLVFIPLLFGLFARAQYCGPYTAHANITESYHSFETITGDSINCGSAPGIMLNYCHDIHITLNKFVNGTTGMGIGVFLQNCYNITIDYNVFDKTATGCYALFCTSAIVFEFNHDSNEQGPYPRGQMIQLNQCSGPGYKIENNISRSDTGIGNYEDHINIYKSNGTNTSPIIIQGNWIYGGGPSSTGSGITLADNGGSYQTALHNIVVNSGHVGMQVAGGTYITVEYNTIYSKITLNSHVGLGYGNYSGLSTNNVLMGHNTIQWRSGYPGDSIGWPHGQRWRQFDTSYAKTGAYAVTRPSDWGTNMANAAIDSTVLTFPLWASCILPPIISYTPSAGIYYAGTAISPLSPVNTGGSVTAYTISPVLPAGLTIGSGNGVISGAATASSPATSYTISASNGGGTATAIINLTINTAIVLPGKVVKRPGHKAISKHN